MDQVFKYDKHKIVTRNKHGFIQSIKPIYNRENDAIMQVHDLILEMRQTALKFPGIKFQTEVNAIPERDFKILKEDLAFNPDFTDHGGRFFYSITVNCVLIAHKEL